MNPREDKDLNNGKTRSTLLGFVGAYLVYLAYGLFQDRAATNTTMSLTARYVFIAVFALAGTALMVYAVALWRRSLLEEKRQDDREDHYSMK